MLDWAKCLPGHGAMPVEWLERSVRQRIWNTALDMLVRHEQGLMFESFGFWCCVALSIQIVSSGEVRPSRCPLFVVRLCTVGADLHVLLMHCSS